MITAQQIKELRDKTGISVSACKKALEEAGGDMSKALAVLQRESAKSAEKKADRTLGSGVIEAYVHNNKKVGVILELKSESDFVSGNEEFRILAKDIAMHIAAMKPEYIREDEISDDSRKTITEVFQKEVAGIDKIPEIKKKMLDGKIGAYFKEKTLLNQLFIKNPDETIGKLLEKNKAKIKEVKRYSI